MRSGWTCLHSQKKHCTHWCNVAIQVWCIIIGEVDNFGVLWWMSIKLLRTSCPLVFWVGWFGLIQSLCSTNPVLCIALQKTAKISVISTMQRRLCWKTPPSLYWQVSLTASPLLVQESPHFNTKRQVASTCQTFCVLVVASSFFSCAYFFHSSYLRRIQTISCFRNNLQAILLTYSRKLTCLLA